MYLDTTIVLSGQVVDESGGVGHLRHAQLLSGEAETIIQLGKASIAYVPAAWEVVQRIEVLVGAHNG